MKAHIGWIATATALLTLGGPARAAVVPFHYVPADAAGKMVLPSAPNGGVGERLSWFGAVLETCPRPPRPTCTLTFCHPCTGRPVQVPLALPEGTPNIEHRGATRIIYNYGS